MSQKRKLVTRVVTANDVDVIYECDICGSYHPWRWDGDCRDDANRYASPEDYAGRRSISADAVEVRDMDARVEADADTTSRAPRGAGRE